jgi:hypothetical protein
MKRVVLAVCCLVLLSVSTAFATEETGIAKTIGPVGAHTTGALVYFTFIEGFKDPTLYNVVYIDMNTPGGKAAFDIVLQAKKTGTKINRIIYNVNSAGMSMVELITAQ